MEYFQAILFSILFPIILFSIIGILCYIPFWLYKKNAFNFQALSVISSLFVTFYFLYFVIIKFIVDPLSQKLFILDIDKMAALLRIFATLFFIYFSFPISAVIYYFAFIKSYGYNQTPLAVQRMRIFSLYIRDFIVASVIAYIPSMFIIIFFWGVGQIFYPKYFLVEGWGGIGIFMLGFFLAPILGFCAFIIKIIIDKKINKYFYIFFY